MDGAYSTEQMLDKVKIDGEAYWFIALIGTPVEERIAETELRIGRRRNCMVTEKCLHCGSTVITPILDTEEFAHPKTAKRVVVAGLRRQPNGMPFTPEGDLINSAHKLDSRNR